MLLSPSPVPAPGKRASKDRAGDLVREHDALVREVVAEVGFVPGRSSEKGEERWLRSSSERFSPERYRGFADYAANRGHTKDPGEELSVRAGDAWSPSFSDLRAGGEEGWFLHCSLRSRGSAGHGVAEAKGTL